MSYRTKVSALMLALLIFFISCKETKNDAFLGSAVVSGDTYQITAVTQGNILLLSKDEGQLVSKGELLAIIDTIPLYLKQMEAQSVITEINLSILAKQTEIKALQSDVSGIRREYLRIDTLASKGAVPSQQRDNLKTQYESAQLRMLASQNSLTSMQEKVRGQQFRIDQIKDQIRRCYLKSPANGLVITRFRSIDEVVGPGNPIMKLPNLILLNRFLCRSQCLPPLNSVRTSNKNRCAAGTEYPLYSRNTDLDQSGC